MGHGDGAAERHLHSGSVVTGATGRSVVENRPYREILICVRAIRRTFGLTDHYFMIIDDKEYHPGYYKAGNVLPVGTTIGAHVACRKTICQRCYERLVHNYRHDEDKRVASFYPLINCESLTVGISVQALSLVAVPLAAGLVLARRWLCALVLLLIATLVTLINSKYAFSRTLQRKCSHLL